ncbi:MAG: hypothetical protein WCJ84_05500 [Candidatus Peregrinibacteria bacterium]
MSQFFKTNNKTRKKFFVASQKNAWDNTANYTAEDKKEIMELWKDPEIRDHFNNKASDFMKSFLLQKRASEMEESFSDSERSRFEMMWDGEESSHNFDDGEESYGQVRQEYLENWYKNRGLMNHLGREAEEEMREEFVFLYDRHQNEKDEF